MKYNDYELVNLIQEGNEEAKKILYNKYLPIINKKANKAYKYIKYKGLELEDIFQECLIAFEESINRYKQDSNSLFYTFTNIFINRKLSSIIRDINREKRKSLNESIPIETEEDSLDIIDILTNNSTNPETLCIDNELYIDLHNRIIEKLTNLEECVFILKEKGFNYKDIAVLLDKNEKSIINALHRIRMKIRDLNV